MEGDSTNLRAVILDSPKQLSSRLDFFNQLNLRRRQLDNILICGMGGSALVGDLLEYLKQKQFRPLTPTLPFQIHRAYDLPRDADERTLIILVSYSGETEEVLSSFRAAQKLKLEITGITCGGQLGDLFQENNIPWIKIAKGLPPRYSLGSQLNGLVKILMAYGLLDSSAQHALTPLSESLNPSQDENRARLACVKLSHKIPVIYASTTNSAIARLWKINFNENTKIPAFYNVWPELNHNELAGWTKNFGPFYFFLLRDTDDSPKIQKQLFLTSQILTSLSLPIEIVDLEGQDALEKFFKAALLADWLSYHLALFYGLDPALTPLIEDFKKRLRE
ncbi:MAG: bifunctional phosphoglucose/phosphomannose isomerase [Patescibacteria group bacterium]